MQSAVETGITYIEYGKQLVQAQQKVDRCIREAVPGELNGVCWKEIAVTMGDYQFALRYWGRKFSSHDTDGANQYCGLDTIRDIRERFPNYPFASTDGPYVTSVDQVVQYAWASAASHLRNADAAAAG